MEFMKSEAGGWAWDWQRLPRCHSLQLHAAVRFELKVAKPLAVSLRSCTSPSLLLSPPCPARALQLPASLTFGLCPRSSPLRGGRSATRRATCRQVSAPHGLASG